MMATAIDRPAPLAQEAAGHVDGHDVAAAAGLGRPVLAGHLVDRDDVEVGQVDQDVDGDDDEHGDGHGPGQGALDVLDLAGHVGDVDPAVVGPERPGHGHDDHQEDRGRAGGAGAEVACRLGEIREAAVPQGEGQHDDGHDDGDLERREDDHDGAAELDAQVVDPGEEDDQADGASLRPMNLKGVIAPMQGMGMLHCSQAAGSRGNGTK